jgi:transcriptional regulator with XRE-family HTH domain
MKINRLKEVFIEHNISNLTIVDLFNVSESTVSRWVNNKQQPDILKFYKIAEYLKIDIRELFYSTKW